MVAQKLYQWKVVSNVAEISDFNLNKNKRLFYQAESHAKSKQTADVSHERRSRHAFVSDYVRRKRVFDVNVEPKQIVFCVFVKHLRRFSTVFVRLKEAFCGGAT